jgi:hypothetical protein
MDQPTLPPVVYAPTIDMDGATRIRMHEMRDGRTALFVYSAIDRLQAQYGDDARWVLLSVDDLQRAFEQVPYDLLFLDRELHPEEAGRG